jgi:polar amino acid transport system substrate-binding protein
MSKMTALAGIAAIVATTLSACGGSDGSTPGVAGDCKPAHADLKTARSGTLTTSTYNFPPFTTLEGTKVGGAEGDIMAEIAAMECLTLTGLPLDTGSVVTAAQSGRADLASGNWYCTAARAEVLSLAGPVYGDELGIVSQDGVDTFDELKGRTIGTVDGYNYNAELQKLFGSDVKIYPTPTAMYTDIKSGRLDAALDSFGSASYANQQNGGQWKVVVPQPDDRIAASKQPGQVCFPIAKSNKALAQAVIEDIETLRDNGRLAEILVDNGLKASAADPGPLHLIS